jgi:hypothetical protein
MSEETIIVIVALAGAFSIPLVWFLVEARSRRDRARVVEKALESGRDPEEAVRALGKTPNLPRRRPYRRGLTLLAVGGTFLIANQTGLLGHGHNGDGGPAFVGLLLALLGVAFLLGDLFDRGGRSRNGERD